MVPTYEVQNDSEATPLHLATECRRNDVINILDDLPILPITDHPFD